MGNWDKNLPALDALFRADIKKPIFSEVDRIKVRSLILWYLRHHEWTSSQQQLVASILGKHRQRNPSPERERRRLSKMNKRQKRRRARIDKAESDELEIVSAALEHI